LIDSAGRRADVLLASRIYEQVLGIEMSNKPPTTGSFASHLKEFESVREFFTSSTIASFTDMAFFGIFLFVIYQVGGVMVAVPAVAAAVLIIMGLAFQIPLRRAAEKNSVETAQRHSLLVESISSLETVKTIRGESHLQRIWESLVGMTAQTVERVRQLNATLANMSSLIQQLVTVGVIVVGAYLFDEGNISTGAIIASVMLASRAVAPLGQFAIVLARSQQSLVSLRSINKIMAMEVERPFGKKFISEPITKCLIQFQNVVFAYPGSGTPAINGINLTIRPGEKVGIIGKIGSGKTTVGRLMTKLYEPQEGAILIDGIDMRQYHPHEIRRVIGLLGQDSELFHGTVRSNILMANPRATDEKLLNVCRLAGVDDFVRRHPKGFDMPVGERGQALSGGQRQSVALARLLINDPQVIFLDEPSSAMDLASERLLIEQLKRSLRADQTIIVSTHRYSMLDLVDRLIVLSNSKIAADGPKEQVLEALKKQSSAARA
jgi:ATP-binding cassette subfamily C protein LapB